jgi:Holliday junction resolvase-like predicted endonuclease
MVGPILVFVEVKTCPATAPDQPHAEEAMNWEKRRKLALRARQFLRIRRVGRSDCRFDIVTMETRPGARPRFTRERVHLG